MGSLFAVALVATLLSFVFVPHKASAAALTVVTATTTSSNASTTLAKIGDTVSFGLNLSGTPVATSTPVINIQGMGTTTMTGSGAWWSYSTTTTSAWNTGAIVFKIGYGDSAPGVNNATTTITQADLTGTNVVIDKTSPTVSTLTSNATASSVLKVGDTIIFTLTPGATEYGATVAGSYNGSSLTWSTADSGVTFTATYTVTEGDTDRTTALQISSVIVTDAASNASSAGAGSDIVKTIDANSPSSPSAVPGAGVFSSPSQNVTLSSSGSNTIYYTEDGTTPTCSSGTTYSGAITVNSTKTITSVGCDTAGNISSSASFIYTKDSSSGGGGSRSSASSLVTQTPVADPITAPATLPSSLNSVQVESIIDLLKSFDADASVIANVQASLRGGVMAGASTPAGTFTRDLRVGSVGDDVRALQIFLNTHGFPVAVSGAGSTGMETTLFGGLTKAALIKFQIANNIAPASGYFGPKTRAVVADK